MSDIVLVGPFWTRAEAAAYLGVTADELSERNDVLRLEGTWLEETYPALQFHDGSVRHEITAIVAEVAGELPGTVIADWLCRTNQLLGAMSPLDWFNSGLSLKTALAALWGDIDEMRSRVNHPPVRYQAVS